MTERALLNLSLVAALLVAAQGCAPCDPRPAIAAAAGGDVTLLHDVGELGDPKVPHTSTDRDPTMQDGFAALVPWLKSEDAAVRLTALEGVRRLCERARDVYRDRFPGALDPLLEDPVADVRWRTAWTLGRLELLSTASGLRKATADRDERVADRAVWALGRMRDEAAIPELTRALDRPGRVSAQAARALGRITGADVGTDPAAWKLWLAKPRGSAPGAPPPQDAPLPPGSPPPPPSAPPPSAPPPSAPPPSAPPTPPPGR